MAKFCSHVVGTNISYLCKQSTKNAHRIHVEEDALSFWELSNSRRTASISLLSPPKMAVWMQPVSPTSPYDMRVACVLQDGAIIVHSLTQDYRPIAEFDTPFYPHGHDANIKCIAFSNMYQLIVTSTDGTLCVFKMGSSGVVDIITSGSRDSDVFKASSNNNGL
jgi:WD40 repeat protein